MEILAQTVVSVVFTNGKTWGMKCCSSGVLGYVVGGGGGRGNGEGGLRAEGGVVASCFGGNSG